MQINSQKKKTGVIAPKRFVQRVKKQNELFRSYMHQVIELSLFLHQLLADFGTYWHLVKHACCKP